jgi:hypothetical protein
MWNLLFGESESTSSEEVQEVETGTKMTSIENVSTILASATIIPATHGNSMDVLGHSMAMYYKTCYGVI